MKIVALDTDYFPPGSFGHWCPGCQTGHEIPTEAPNSKRPKWTFDGNMIAPTFHPSINIRVGRYADPNYKPQPGDDDHSSVCHYFIRNGIIEFLGDCTHALHGQKVPLPELPESAYFTSQHKARHR